MPPKCFTKTANDGHSYTTCIDEKTKPKPKIKIKIKKATHKMPDGTTMSGTTHSAASKPVVKKKKIVIMKQEGPRNLKKGFGIRSGAPTVQAPTKAAPSQLTKMTGLSRADANKMDPAQLFGMLPSGVKQMALIPSQRGGGPKVARASTEELVERYEKNRKGGKKVVNLMREIGRKYGRLPSTVGIETDKGIYQRRPGLREELGGLEKRDLSIIQVYRRLAKKFGSKFKKEVRLELEKKLTK